MIKTVEYVTESCLRAQPEEVTCEVVSTRKGSAMVLIILTCNWNKVFQNVSTKEHAIHLYVFFAEKSFNNHKFDIVCFSCSFLICSWSDQTRCRDEEMFCINHVVVLTIRECWNHSMDPVIPHVGKVNGPNGCFGFFRNTLHFFIQNQHIVTCGCCQIGPDFVEHPVTPNHKYSGK